MIDTFNAKNNDLITYQCPHCHMATTLPTMALAQQPVCPACDRAVEIELPELPPPPPPPAAKKKPQEPRREAPTTDSWPMELHWMVRNPQEPRREAPSSVPGEGMAWIGCIIVCIGTCLPWVTAQTGGTFRQAGLTITTSSQWIELSGLTSTANVMGVAVPGWCVAIAALLAAAMRKGNPFCVFILTAYGVLHVSFMGFAISNTPSMEPAFGLAIVLAGQAALLLSLTLGTAPSR